MSLAMAAMRVRSRQVQNQGLMKVKRLEKPQHKDQIIFTVPENVQHFVRVICETLQKWFKKRLILPDGKIETDQIYKRKTVTYSECNAVYNAVQSRHSRPIRTIAVPRTIKSKPISIPTRDRHGQRYPAYERKQFQYI